MFRTHQLLTVLIFIYAIAHVVYPLFDNSGLASAEQVMWFLSGGLAVFFTGLINLMYLTLKGSFQRRITVITNAIMLIFMIVLCLVISEIQVFILAAILLLTLIAAAITSLPNVSGEKGNQLNEG
jgi:hypothetical protein